MYVHKERTGSLKYIMAGFLRSRDNLHQRTQYFYNVPTTSFCTCSSINKHSHIHTHTYDHLYFFPYTPLNFQIDG